MVSVSDLSIPLIHLLADGQCHSGESIGRCLGVSRAAVWKRIQRLDALGLQVESVRGAGYRLSEPLDLLDAASIERELHRGGVANVHVLDGVDSTNAFLLSREVLGVSACIAEYQSAGRGRRGRQWVSPYGSNLYFSIGLEVSEGVAALEGLSLAVGVVLRSALDALNFEGVQLKWPNDLLLDGKKLGGVLVEVGGDLSGPCSIVVGVGINVAMSASALTEKIDQPWAELRCKEQGLSRTHLAQTLILKLVEALKYFPEQKFAFYRHAWLKCAAYMHEKVSVVAGRNRAEGKLVGVTDTGALQLRLDNGDLASFVGGEVSLRKVS